MRTFESNGTKWILLGPIGGLANSIGEFRNPGAQNDLPTCKKLWLAPTTVRHESRAKAADDATVVTISATKAKC